MESLSIRLLGELVLSEGQSRLPPSRRTRALLAYLTVERRAHSRQRLCDLFWSGPHDPRAALRWSLSKLRSVLPIETAGEHVQVGEALLSDTSSVQRLLLPGVASVTTSELVQVAQLFRGEPLEGLDIRDCFQFQEWLVATREHWRARQLAVLDELVTRLRSSEPEQALIHARKRLAVDPLTEAGHVTIVQLLARVGRVKEAIGHFERCKHMLESELGAQRWPALEQARAALNLSVGSSAETGSAPPSALVDPAPDRSRSAGAWVGRDAELDLLTQTLSSGGVALVLGEPGIGKSRLLQASGERASAAGVVVLRGRAFEAEMIRPYGAVVDALRSIPLLRFPAETTAHLAPLVPELSRQQSQQGFDRERLFDGVLSFAHALAKTGQRIALVLDDVQWLDDASAALVHFLARADEPFLAIALGARAGELQDNPPILRLVRSLRRDNALREIALAPLSLAETRALLQAFGPAADPAVIHEVAGGNPLFALELAHAGASGHAPGQLPDTLLGLLGERLERLDERARGLVPWAATLGHSFALETLGAVSGASPEELLRGVEELERRGVLKVAAAGVSQFGYDFAHDLVRRAAYHALSEPRRRLCHARAAAVLWSQVETDATLASDVAHHAALAGDHTLTARACAYAGARCLRLFAYAEALELVKLGRRHVTLLPGGERRALEIPLLQLLVHAAAPAQHDEIDARLSSVLAEARAAGERSSVVNAAKALAVLRYYRGDLPGAGDVTVTAANAVRDSADPHEVANELAQSARCLTLVGRIEESRELLGEALEVSQKGGVFPIELPFAQATLAHFEGELGRARELFEKTVEAARRFDDHWRGAEALGRLVMIAVEQDQLERARSVASELASLADRMEKDGAEQRFAEALIALIDLRAAPAPAPATLTLERAIDRLRDIDTKAFLVYSLLALAEVELGLARYTNAEAHATEAAALARRIKSPSDLSVATALVAQSFRARGDEPGARQVLADASSELSSGEEVSARARLYLARAKARP
jgi:DNA-binding SARP family transcriptional activator